MSEREPMQNLEELKESPLYDVVILGAQESLSAALPTPYIAALAELTTGLPAPVVPGEPTSVREHFNQDEKVSDYITAVMKGKHVLDLGCGVQAVGYQLAQFTQAAHYTAVEKHFARSAQQAIQGVSTSEMPHEIVQADMMDYLRQSPEPVDVILLTGIDLGLISSRNYDFTVWETLMSAVYAKLSHSGKLFFGGAMTPPEQEIHDQYFTLDETFARIIFEFRNRNRSLGSNRLYELYQVDLFDKRPTSKVLE